MDDIEVTIKRLLRKYKVRCRSISVEDDKVTLSIEDYKANQSRFLKELQRLRLFPQNLVYGRWVFVLR